MAEPLAEPHAESLVSALSAHACTFAPAHGHAPDEPDAGLGRRGEREAGKEQPSSAPKTRALPSPAVLPSPLTLPLPSLPLPSLLSPSLTLPLLTLPLPLLPSLPLPQEVGK